MIALAVDMMSVFQMRYGSMDAAEGIVLIDELGAHLHPRWQMRIVHAFREAFPRLQVIATTHDPLCLRGMNDRDAGVEGRRVRLAEGQAQQLAAVIRAILTDLGHDLADEHVREVVRLRLTEGGNGDRQLPAGRP